MPPELQGHGLLLIGLYDARIRLHLSIQQKSMADEVSVKQSGWIYIYIHVLYIYIYVHIYNDIYIYI